MNQPPDLIATAFKMFIVLGILLGGLIVSLYLVKKALGRRGNSQSKARMVKVLASSYIGVKKSISLVEVPGSVLILGITNDHINLLARIDDADTIEKITAQESDTTSWSFSDHIQKISSRYKREKR